MSTFLAFLGVSLIVIVTPGPDTAITIRNALFGGRGGGVHSPRNCARTDDLGFHDKPGYRRSPGRFRDAVPRRQICRVAYLV